MTDASALFRIVSVTPGDGSRVQSATALATGPSLDFIRAVIPAVTVSGASPATVILPGSDIPRLHRVASRIGADDFRSEGSVPVRDALRDLAGTIGATA